MAAGLSVLSTDVSAIPEVVVDGETGILVAVDDPEALTQAMLRLAADGNLRQTLAHAGGLRVVEHFGLDTMVDQTLQVYAEVTGKPLQAI